MNILYVTPPWPGFRECLFEGAEYPHGLPSFNKPLMALIEKGYSVDFVILNSAYRPEYNLSNLNIKASWLKKSQIIDIVETDLRLHKKMSTYNKLKKSVKKALGNKNYDFVYAHGSSTSVVRSIANNYNVPFGQRLYGTFLWDKIQKKNKFYVSIRHIVEYRVFKTPKSFLLVTNDGSRGDLVKNAILGEKKPPYEFYYWINGVEAPPVVSEEELKMYSKKITNKPFLFHVARFDSWKRQDRLVRILSDIRKKGYDIHLYLAGPQKTIGDTYFKSVVDLVEELNLKEHVTLMGNIDIKTISMMCKLATASFSLNDVCNLTNVFHEMLAAGAVVIVQKDGTTDDFIVHGKNGFFVENDKEAVDIIADILDSKLKPDVIRTNAIETSKAKMKTWKERAELEIALIERHSKKQERPQNFR